MVGADRDVALQQTLRTFRGRAAAAQVGDSFVEKVFLVERNSQGYQILVKLEWENPTGSMKDTLLPDSELKYLGTDVYRRSPG